MFDPPLQLFISSLFESAHNTVSIDFVAIFLYTLYFSFLRPYFTCATKLYEGFLFKSSPFSL
jgi:hypothetical protein